MLFFSRNDVMFFQEYKVSAKAFFMLKLLD